MPPVQGPFRAIVAFGVLVSSACGFTSGAAPAGTRVIHGKLVPPDPSVFSRSQVALQFAAASIDAREASPLLDLELGPAFNPAANSGEPVSFTLAVPSDRSFVLFFQVPVDNGLRLGQLAARVTFAKNGAGDLGSLVSGRLTTTGPVVDLDLGVVNIVPVRTSEGMDVPRAHVATLGSDGSLNPLAQNDVDGDGVPDVDDEDDDDDLIPDQGDDDANGDGVPDAQQTLEALQDGNANDVPDLFEMP